jgi:hypothetical protein
MSDGYVLGHSDRELARLAEQARLIGPITRRIFERAGIARGMRVLDVGSGVGDVAFLVADLVGAKARSSATTGWRGRWRSRAAARAERGTSERVLPRGDPAQAEVAVPSTPSSGRTSSCSSRTRPRRSGASRVTPARRRRGVPRDRLERRAVVPAGADLRRRVPLDRRGRRALRALPRAWGCTSTGRSSPRTFPPRMHLEAQIEGAVASLELVRLTSDLAISLLPEMERFGVDTAAEVSPETLEERMIAEIVAGRGAVTGRSEIGAWARTASS